MFTYPARQALVSFLLLLLLLFFFLIERSKGTSEEEMGRLSPFLPLRARVPFLPLRARVPFFSFRPKKKLVPIIFLLFSTRLGQVVCVIDAFEWSKNELQYLAASHWCREGTYFQVKKGNIDLAWQFLVLYATYRYSNHILCVPWWNCINITQKL